ncbi:TetR/AcrR family transcriptional regulator [Pseudocnuella soli]|uniref:TetR/AcrR family transcriptional regulator n=1 Tax=Pseudocnuella soli TaxID=2502779 RepID=UPI001047D3B4|nr:TetR/AcrR family transcriptional regulator [Pseudocnuella soli]
MGIAERKQRQKEGVRTAILQAAWQMVEQEGWQALSLRKIADAIEYSVPVIYDHFENKEAILLEFTRKGFQLLNEQLHNAVAGKKDGADQLTAISNAYWNFAFSHAEYYQLMYGLGMPSCETVRQIPELSSFTDLLLQTVKAIIASGNSKDADPWLKLHTFWSMLHGLISINMMGKEKKLDPMQQAVLHDFTKSFIQSLKE